ncbi:MAG: hypothetical protein ACOC8L_04505 [Spirochaetota bacterium]
MKLKVVAPIVVALLLIAACTPGSGLADIATNLEENDGETVTVSGRVGRGIQVTGTSIYLVLLEEDGYRVPVLTATEHAYGDDITVTGTVYAYDGVAYDEMEPAVQEALAALVDETEEETEDQTQVFTESAARFIRTYTIGSEADYFIIESENE